MKMYNVEKATIEELVKIAKSCEGEVKFSANGEAIDVKENVEQLDVMTQIFSRINLPEINIHTNTPSDLNKFVTFLMGRKIA